MFVGSETEESVQRCGYPGYNTMNQAYNMNYNVNVYQNCVYPMGITANTVTSDFGENLQNQRQIDEKELNNFLEEIDNSENEFKIAQTGSGNEAITSIYELNEKLETNCEESGNNKNLNQELKIVQKKSAKIAYAKNAITSIYKLNKKLKINCEELKNNENLTEEEWQEKMSICNTAREEILKLMEPIKNEDFLKRLKRDLERRKRKRLRERVKRKEWGKEKLMRIERRKKLHAQIDLWIRKEQAVIEREKQEENLRKDADLVLSDVRGKRSDAKKYLGLLQELRNLRNVKVNIARARGEHLSSAADEAFNSVLAKLTEQWTKLDREYSIEEQGLKLMLKTDNEERIEKQKRSLFDDWEKVLFGKKICTDQCNMDLTNFIATRAAWDKYISSDHDASAIPIGWVMPIKPTSAAWQKCLRKEI